MTTLQALRRAAVAAGMALVVIFAWPAAASNYDAQPVIGGGGDHDGPPMVCPDSHPLLTGFFGKTGLWLDRIGIVCSELLPGYKTGNSIEDQYRGGNGGGLERDVCDKNGGIRNIDFGIAYKNGKPQVVTFVAFRCFRPADGSPAGHYSFSHKLDNHPVRHFDDIKDYRQWCTGSEYAVGLDVRWGSHVNAVGLICRKLNPPIAKTPWKIRPPKTPPSPQPSQGPATQQPKNYVPAPTTEPLLPGMQDVTTRSGPSYRSFQLLSRAPETCQQECRNDPARCRSWVYVRPRFQGSAPLCFLKSTAPQAQPDACCISGVEASSNPPPGGDGPNIPPCGGASGNPCNFPNVPRPPEYPQAGTCKQGFVWREARPSDQVCVTPESRSTVRQENASAYTRWDPNGAYGPNTCIAGFVWREAFDGDVVCVTPERRAMVKQENQMGPSRTY